MTTVGGLPTDTPYYAVFVCFLHRSCGFVFERTPEDRTQQLLHVMLPRGWDQYDCNCFVMERFWACVVYCDFE